MLRRGRALLQAGLRSCRASSQVLVVKCYEPVAVLVTLTSSCMQAGWLETTSLRSPVPCSSPVQLRVLRQVCPGGLSSHHACQSLDSQSPVQVTGLCRASQPWQQWPGWECRHTHASLQQRLAIAQQWRTVVTSKLKPKHVGGKRKVSLRTQVLTIASRVASSQAGDAADANLVQGALQGGKCFT